MEPTASQLATLRTLVVLHWVFVALLVLCSIGWGAYGALIDWALTNQPANRPQSMTPQFASYVKSIALVYGVGTFGLAVANVAMAINLSRRRGWTFLMVGAAIDCLVIPVGTALGVFALVTLQKPEFQAVFGREVAPPRL